MLIIIKIGLIFWSVQFFFVPLHKRNIDMNRTNEYWENKFKKNLRKLHDEVKRQRNMELGN
jgi:hypothetical protein